MAEIYEVVFPDARFKYFITASPEERAMRRYKELKAKGQDITFDQVLHDIQQRDKNDSDREVSPMKKADDAELLDTTNMTIQQVVKYICDEVRKA